MGLQKFAPDDYEPPKRERLRQCKRLAMITFSLLLIEDVVLAAIGWHVWPTWLHVPMWLVVLCVLCWLCILCRGIRKLRLRK